MQGFRLSPIQKRIWQSHPAEPLVCGQCAILLDGPLDHTSLDRAMQTVTERHEILRTSYYHPIGLESPLQVVSDNALTCARVAGINELEQPSYLAGLFEYEASQLGSLQRPRPRACLIQLSRDKHLMVFTLPQLSCDMQTLANLLYELSNTYEACIQGADREAPAVQYLQYSEWQNALSEDADNMGLKYWLERAASAPPPVKLPFETTSTRARGTHLQTRKRLNGDDLLNRIDAVGSQHGATLEMFLLACLQTLLWRVSGQCRFTLCRLFEGRKFEELQSGLGLFAKWIPVDCQVDRESSFGELLKSVDKSIRDMLVWEEFFTADADSFSAVPDTSMIGFEYVEWPPIVRCAGVSFSMYKQHICFDRFKLKVRCTRFEQSLETEFLFYPDIIDDDYVHCLARQFQVLVEAACQDPEAKLPRLDLLTEDDREQVLKEFNQTGAEYDKTASLPQRFEARVQRTPDHCALIYEGEEITYRELNASANRLAHYLIEIGVGPETLIGLCINHSIDLVIGLLAILKAGGAYVPLEPSHPRQRLACMIENAKIQIVLAQQERLELLTQTGCQVISLDSQRQQIFRYRSDNPSRGLAPDNLAYVIHTSGSTGPPKGVMVTHVNVTRLLDATQKWYQFDTDDVWTMFHSYAFDFSVWELWGALINGGRLVIVSRQVSRSPEAFHQLMCQQQVTVLNQTPSAFRQFLQAESAGAVTEHLPLRLVIFGGEALDLESLRGWIERQGDEGPQMINMYGITETTVHVTYRTLRMTDLDFTTGSKIGRPIDDLQVYLVDERLEPVAVGVDGEIFVGGDGLGRGYLHRPGLTAERFIANPYSDHPGSRLYRSGDIGRYRGSGEIEYAGRCDRQVKVRGFRVELGEIESTLYQHPAVRESVVVLREDSADERMLVAYVVSDQETELTTGQLRRFLKERLPEYMIPAAFIKLELLPLTINGKLDREALPEPKELRPALENSYVTPRTETEQIIAEIWGSVLHIDQVGIYDNFFDLGGNSMSMLQILGKLRSRFDVELTTVDLFKYPTLASLVDYLSLGAAAAPAPQDEQARGQHQDSSVVRRRQMRRERRSSMGGGR
jgi:amino acid adenylation domain-containing protein